METAGSSSPGRTAGAGTVRRRRKLNGPTSSSPAAGTGGPGADATAIRLPPHIGLPITVARICVPEASGSVSRKHVRQDHPNVDRGTPLFHYYAGLRPPTASQRAKGKGKASQDEEQAEDDGPPVVSFDSPVEGTLEHWHIAEGQVLREEDGWRNRQVVSIKEPCTHAVQWQGQCAICGKDLTNLDYTGVSDTSRATLAVSHSTPSLTVSLKEAQRLDSETKTRLLADRKLSLIVDLDQTIVHATVDPTVGEWMDDQTNPNWEVLQGVGKFQLADPTAPPGAMPDADHCWYYLKKRPGLDGFLKEMATSYEMHIYTMGTRAYATAVCKFIDPTGELFGGRILSRDESGSLTQKSLTRLFPVDTSMVVVIDDRADVWENSPNLVAVVPYNFFVGIGDINGAFLPKRDATTLQPPPSVTVTPDSSEPTSSEVVLEDGTDSTATSPPPAEPAKAEDADAPPPTSAGTNGVHVLAVDPAVSVQSQVLSEQLQVRPLKKRQEELEAAIKERKERRSRGSANGSSRQTTPSSRRSSRASTPANSSAPPSSAPPSPVRGTSVTTAETTPPLSLAPPTQQVFTTANLLGLQTTGASPVFSATDGDTESEGDESDEEWTQEAVLVDRDTELTRLGEVLGSIHDGFYSQDFPQNSDTREVIAAFKSEALIGAQLAFSSCWPIEAVPEEQDRWKQALALGAQCVHNITPATTHLVSARYGTAKVNEALKRGDIFVVLPQWLVDAGLFWRRPPEQDYLWQRALAIKASASLPAVSSDEDDEEQVAEAGGEEQQEFDWKGANDEIMAFLEDTDSSEDPTDDAAGADGSSKKRSRKNSTASSAEGVEPGGESPLSKRQRLARARSSKLRLDALGDGVEGPDQRRPSSSSESLGVSHAAEEDSYDIDLDALDQELFAD